MPPKRKRRASPPARGLAAGQKLRRSALPTSATSPWSWVDTEVQDASDISPEHLLSTCGFSKRSTHPFCHNKLASPEPSRKAEDATTAGPTNGELREDVIVISDDEVEPECSKKSCKHNPNCLNYLGQEAWETEEGEAWQEYVKSLAMGEDPSMEGKDPDIPVGLKNLGATCYANAFLQVWFRDLSFRAAVYKCQPSGDKAEERFKESPIFQLQYTFAAMQECAQSVFNPTNLVESLQLRTSEQQDAQEFSKLFMSHLDAEFRKQTLPSLRTLVSDQFEGKQAYGTVCSRCSYRSEQTNTFLEIEINLEAHATLESRIEALLKPELLAGDNKYLCPQCQSLQDATRYTDLRELPPILHFSLLRFVYDLTSMERKKSKHIISFPKSIDMARFLRPPNAQLGSAASPPNKVYHLRGILLHKGPSAYHGHYEAQVFDPASDAWFQFNDEVVTRITELGDKRLKAKGGDESVDTQDKKNAKKRRRVDSDDELALVSPPKPAAKEPSELAISSKDAYMLIYASADHEQDRSVPVPPDRAMEQVRRLNIAHDQACEAFRDKMHEAKADFDKLRLNVLEILKSWQISSDSEPSVVASSAALKTWISKYSVGTTPEPSKSDKSAQPPNDQAHNTIKPDIRSISVDGILCSHKLLDPSQAQSMKRVSQRAYDKMVEYTKCTFEPELGPNDVCRTCVAQTFSERFYQIQHPRHVRHFEQLSSIEDDDCAFSWISKHWLRDWRMTKPKMHVACQDDPSPSSTDYLSHVLCEHGCLTMNTTNRLRVGAQASSFLQQIFPAWEPVDGNSEVCPICEAEVHESKGQKLAVRKQAEDEKARLKHMYDNALNGNMALLENVPCAIIPTQFIRSWRQWLSKPTELPRPDAVDNSPFLCQHSMLNFDPNCPNDMDMRLSVIKLVDWHVLGELYPADPLIAIEKCKIPDVSLPRYVCEMQICEPCRHQRQTTWDSTDITIRILGTEKQKAKPESKTSTPYGALQTGARQSKRLRQVKESGEKRRLSITKQTTLKDIKVMVQSQLNIPTICQRLFYKGKELNENTATAGQLGFLANDVIDLREEIEVHEVDSDIDVDAGPPTKRKREEGGGFGGTLLTSQPPSSRENTPAESHGLDKSCPQCTFANANDADVCAMCNLPFI